MREVSYEIAINVKAPGGWHSFGYFQMGGAREQAAETFDRLLGSVEAPEAPLRIELFEHGPGESVLVAQKGCTLNELAENTRIIARDIFKYFNLG